MHWQYTPYVLPLVIAAAISGAIGLVAWRRRHVPGATPLLVLVLAVVEWSLGNVLELGSAELEAKLFWANLEYLGIVTVPVMWLTFALQYTGRDKHLTYRNLALLAVVPLITLLLVWTNNLHGLMRYNIRLDRSGPFSVVAKTYGMWFWVNAAYSYGLLLLGTVILLQVLFRPPRLYRGQAAALLVGALAPWLGNALYISGLSPIPRLDVTPCAFAISGLAIAWGLLRFRLLDIAPMARGAVIEGMGDGTILLDGENRVLDVNPAAQRIIGCTPLEAIGQPATRVLSGQPDLLEGYHQATEKQTEITLGKGEAQRYYSLRISPLARRHGHLVVLREITEQKRAEAALRESRQKIESLHETARHLGVCETEEKVYQLTVDVAEKILDFPMCHLAIVEGGKLVTKAMSSGLPAEASRDRKLDEGLAGKTYRTGKTHILGNLDEGPQAKQLQESFKSAISAPIGDMGVVQVLSAEPNSFTEDDARLLEMLLGHTVEALKRIRLQNKLKEQAIHDPLTGSYNRRYFTHTMEKELERSKRYDHPIAFLMVDINRFKEINDRFGHQMGDRVLREVGKLLQEQVRKVDSVVRYGGDEFLIVLPEKSSDTEAVVQRIRQAVAKWNKKIPLLDFPLTLAIGTSYWHPGRVEPVEAALYDADRRMYTDKERQATAGSEKT